MRQVRGVISLPDPNFISLVFLGLELDDELLSKIAHSLTKRQLYVEKLLEKSDKLIIISLRSERKRDKEQEKNLYLVIRKLDFPSLSVWWEVTSKLPQPIPYFSETESKSDNKSGNTKNDVEPATIYRKT